MFCRRKTLLDEETGRIMGSILSIFEGFKEPLFVLFAYIGSGFVANVCDPVRKTFKRKKEKEEKKHSKCRGHIDSQAAKRSLVDEGTAP
jgi:hypothetical protein